MKQRKIICIVGPTASGKTGWGVSVARKYNGEIISADSRQVYKKLDIGTGKDLEEYGEIKYHLIDICDPKPQRAGFRARPGEKFTMFDWLERAKATIEDIFSRGKTPIIVGGTGLYVQALVEGFELETKKLKVKSKKYSRDFLEKQSLEKLHRIFAKFPTGSAKARKIENSKIDLENPYRLIRAIERAQSGEIVSKKKPDFEVLQIAIDLPRGELYQRIDLRVDQRFEQGMLEEIKYLIASGVNKDWLLSLGLEYRIIASFVLGHPRPDRGSTLVDSRLRGNDSFDEMKQRLKYAIHAYARRQLIWFRRFPEIIWCKNLVSAEKEIRKFLL